MKEDVSEIGRMLRDYDKIEVANYNRPEGKPLQLLRDYFSELSEDDVGVIFDILVKGR